MRAVRAGYAWIGAGPDALRQMAEEVAQTREVDAPAGSYAAASRNVTADSISDAKTCGCKGT